MNPKYFILTFTAIVGAVLSFYILDQESQNEVEMESHVGHNHEPTIQVANRGETKITLKSGYSQICLFYTSDAADDLPRVDLCGSRSTQTKPNQPTEHT